MIFVLGFRALRFREFLFFVLWSRVSGCRALRFRLRKVFNLCFGVLG